MYLLVLEYSSSQAIELLKRVGAFAAALEIVNNRLSDAVNSVSKGRMDGETKAAGLILAGNSIIEATKVLGVTRFVRS
mgnify:FL=1